MARIEIMVLNSGPGWAGAPPAKRPTVLLVDSCDLFRQALRTLLRESGYGVAEALNGLEGLRSARDRTPGLIVVDLWPFFSGSLQMVEELRASDVTRGIPVLVHTSAVSPEYWSRALAAGCVEYLEKPCRPERLMAEVFRVVPGPRMPGHSPPREALGRAGAGGAEHGW